MAEPLRCSLNVTFHFPGVPLLDALDGAARAGFHTIELLDPYSPELDDLERELKRRGLRLDLFNLPMGDFAAGDRGIAADPERRDEFRRGTERAVVIAARLGATKVNGLVGRRIDTIPESSQLALAAEQLGWAAERLESLGVSVVTEMLNPVESPGLLLRDLATTRWLVEQLEGRVGLLLDLYHLQRTHGELIRTIEATSAITRHVQIADAPGRSEPGSGEIAYGNVLAALAGSGYAGIIGCEYRPSGPDVDPFAWMDQMGAVKA